MADETSVANDAERERLEVRAMTAKQLAQLGVSQIAYVRPVMMDGAVAYSIHGADGTPMALAPDHDMAVAAIEQQDLMQVLIH